ncbi:hypothetical protein EJB05_51836, partial [Eragrostis curvula]
MAMSSGSDVTASMMLHGRVAIVTGGAGGIGSAVSKHLASLGARVAVAYIGDPSPAWELVSGINSAHAGAEPRAIAVEADVSDAAQVKALFDAAAAASSTSCEAVFEATFGANARGAILCCREAACRLTRGCGRGRIVTFSSPGVASLRPRVRRLRREQGGGGGDCKDPRARDAAPGSTPMFYNSKTEDEIERYIAEAPLGRLGMPEDIAPLVGFLASDAGH